MATYEGATVKEAIIKAMMAVCRPCGCPGAGSVGSPTVCGCSVPGGLCLTVEGTAFSPDPPITQLALEGDFPLTETTWTAVVGEVEYSITCVDITDPENPISTEEWFTGAGELLGDYSSSTRWFWTEWQTDSDGYFNGTTAVPIEWRHVVSINESGCVIGIYTFYRLDGGHTVVRDWCSISEPGPTLSIFYYSNEVENETGFCTTATNVVTQTNIVGTCEASSFSCNPFLIEKNFTGTFQNLWDAGEPDFVDINAWTWSLYACAA